MEEGCLLCLWSVSLLPRQFPLLKLVHVELITRKAWENSATVGFSLVLPLCLWHPKNCSNGSCESPLVVFSITQSKLSMSSSHHCTQNRIVIIESLYITILPNHLTHSSTQTFMYYIYIILICYRTLREQVICPQLAPCENIEKISQCTKKATYTMQKTHNSIRS